MILENFIVFEGIDGAGTSTQLKKLAERCPAEKLFITAEPTQLPTGRFLRQILAGEIQVDERTTSYLFAADRCEHIWGRGGIAENAAAGKLVVSDRYFFSTFAYQSVTCGETIPRLVNSPFPLPQILFYFKIDPHLSLERVDRRGEKHEIYENLPFLLKTAARYDTIMAEYRGTPAAESMQLVTIDAAAPVAETAEIIWSYLENLPILKS